MRIAVIAPTEIPARRANTIQVMKMSQAIAALGHDVHLLAPQNRGHLKWRDESSGSIIEDGTDWEQLANFYGLKTQFPIHFLAASSAFRRYDFSLEAVKWARRWKSDLIYTRLPQAAALSAISGIGTILEIHDIPHGFAGPFLFWLFLHGRKAHRLVVITSTLADDLQQRYNIHRSKPDLIIAPDGVDMERYDSIPEPVEARSILNKNHLDRLGMKLERFTAGYTGHLYSGRGVDLIFQMAERLPEMDFLIVGGEDQEISRLRKILVIQKITNICMTGFVPNSELPPYQAACDVLLMPYQNKVAASSGGDISRYLSPMKLFEYLACGRPIISGKLPVFNEVLNDNNAILLNGAEVESWTQALKELQTDPHKGARLGSQARHDALKYTWEKRARLILEGIA